MANEDTCRPVTLPSGEAIPVRGAHPMNDRDVAALEALVAAARRKMIAEQPEFSCFDRDPEAVAWARGKVQAEIDRLARWHEKAKTEGKAEQAEHWRRIAGFLNRKFIGGHVGVIARFDERLPEWVETVDAARAEAES